MDRQIDQQKSDAFADRMIQMLNEGSLALMTSLGHRTGLFDTMSLLKSATSQEIADRSKLSERYIREWLGAMVTGKIIDYDPEQKTYSLPKEHASWLTRAASPDNIAVFAQYISVLGDVEDQIIECFKEGCGVPYEAFTRFHQVMAEDSYQTVVSALLEHIIPLVPGLKESLQKGIKVMDVGCGSARALNLLAKTFPRSQFFGFDLSRETIEEGKKLAKQQNLGNIQLYARDTNQWNEIEEYDLITTFDAVHDQADPGMVLAKIYQALNPDGIYFMQDIAGSSYLENNLNHPIAPFLYTISTMHCMTVSLAQNGAGLGTMWGKEKAIEMLKTAGFKKIEIKRLEHDFQNYFYIVTKN